MENKKRKYIKIPLILIGLTLCISGIRWLISDKPWILDQVANEERLQMSFSDYVFGLGFFLLSFSTSKMLDIVLVRERVLIVLGLLLSSNIILAYFWIPSSHFIYIMWVTIALYCVSLYNHKKY